MPGQIPELHGLTPYSFGDPLKAILSWSGTVFPLVIFRFELMFFLGIHTFFVMTKQLGWSSDAQFFVGLEPWKMLSLTSSMLAFFVVFLASQAYSRFVELYKATTDMNKALQVIASTTSVHVSDQPELRWQAIRYCIASALLVYSRVNDGDVTKQNMDEEEWRRLTTSESVPVGKGFSMCPPVLTRAEVAALKAWEGNKPMLLQTWALHAFKKALLTKGADEASVMLVWVQLQNDVMKLRDATGAIINTLLLPIPFAYFHICVALTYFTYTILAVILVPMDTIWSLPFFFLVIVLMSGMREVAGAMSDPFGDDATDFPVEKLMREVRLEASLLATHATLPPTKLGGRENDPAAMSTPPSTLESVLNMPLGWVQDAIEGTGQLIEGTGQLLNGSAAPQRREKVDLV